MFTIMGFSLFDFPPLNFFPFNFSAKKAKAAIRDRGSGLET